MGNPVSEKWGEVTSAREKGNSYSALHTSKSLSELDRLRLENTKLKVDLAQAKKVTQ